MVDKSTDEGGALVLQIFDRKQVLEKLICWNNVAVRFQGKGIIFETEVNMNGWVSGYKLNLSKSVLFPINNKAH